MPDWTQEIGRRLAPLALRPERETEIVREFDVDTAAAHQTGTVSGNTMHGSATWTIPTQSGNVVLSGTWSATR